MNTPEFPVREDLPVFSRLRPEAIEAELDELLADNRRGLQELLAQNTDYTWDNLITPLEEMDDRLNRFWSPVHHLHAVADSESLRKAYNACLPKLTDYATEMGQNAELFAACRQIAEGPEYQDLDPAQCKVIDNMLRDFRLSGVALDPERKAEFKTVQQQLSRAQTRFEENLLDATHGWSLHITERERLRGLPDSALALAEDNARRQDKAGWVLTLDIPSYLPVMQYAEDPELRREMYEAYVTRASDQGPDAGQWDNGDLMVEILSLRARLAALLDLSSYAEYSLKRKMAQSPQAVFEFLRSLVDRARPVALREVAELKDFSRRSHKVEDLNAWDLAFYSERLRQDRFDFSQEDLRPYFPVPRVIDGLFQVVEKLYGLAIRERRGVDAWHPDVSFYDIFDAAGRMRGGFYLDLYARNHKRGGAWMDECLVRKRLEGETQIPVAYLTCNFTPPVGGEDSLLTHDEVTTLFHEFGHGLHHMLTLVDYPAVAGINGVPWDAVELPSQFLENWCWERESLDLFARHYQSGEALPQALLEKMQRARNFQSGMHLIRQLEFALFDFRLHHEPGERDGAAIQSLLDDVRHEVAVIIPPAYNRFQHSFSHIFAGGYAAGYYSYLWAEVLSADAFSKFEENGIFNRTTGEEFLHTILEQGGSRDPMELFIEFRGRAPRIDALLRHCGITAQTTAAP
ncbi:MAG: oligopeptidase A [Gammaproteobacteria bacterium]